MSRKIKINGQLVDFETLVSRDNDYKNKIWRYRKDGEVEAVDSTSLNDDDIVFSGSKSNLRRLADIERNVSILSTKVLTATNTNSYDSDDDDFGSIFDQDVRFKGEVRIDSTPTNTTDAVSKGYVDTAVSNVSVDLTGYATETFVNTAVSNLVDAAPTTLDTLNELAAALGDDPNFATTVTNSIGLKANSADLATVATTGSYNDLLNLPTLFDGAYSSLTGAPTIPADVADLTDTTNLLTHFSGNYNDLTNLPTLFDGQYSSLTGAPSIPADISDLTDTTSLLGQGGSSVEYSTTAPSTPSTGDLWYDTSVAEMYIWSGSAWISTTPAIVVDLSTSSIDDFSDVDTTTSAPANGDLLIWNATNGAWEPGAAPATYGDSDVGTYLSSNGYDTAANITAAIVDAAPTTLDTLNELAAALGDDPNFATTISNQIGLKADTAAVVGLVTANDLDMGTNKILYSNVYSLLTDLPSASSYHGMFAHVHATGKAYYAHAGSWIELANVSELFDGQYSSLTGTPTIPTDLSDLTDTTNLLFSGAYADLTGAPTIPSALTDLGITDGTANQVLVTDGAGNFTFADAAGGGASVTTSTTAPTSPNAGDLWFDTDEAILYVYYDDGTSSQWVQTSEVSANGGTSHAWSEAVDPHTMVANDRLFVDTSTSAVQVNLPASPTMGTEVRIIDATGNASTNNITINRNGNNIEGVAENLVIDVNRAAFGLVYYNAAQGWLFMEK